MEDKDRDFLLGLLSIPTSKPVSEPVPNYMSEPTSKNPQETNFALENIRFGKVFSRRNKAVPKSEQVQDSNLVLKNSNLLIVT